MECLEPDHRLPDFLDKAMILFKDIVQIPYLANMDLRALACEFQDGVDRLKPHKVSAAFVDYDPFRRAV